MAAMMTVEKALSRVALSHAKILERSQMSLDEYAHCAALTKWLLESRTSCPADDNLRSLRASIRSEYVKQGRSALALMFGEFPKSQFVKEAGSWTPQEVEASCRLLNEETSHWSEKEVLALEMTPLFLEVERSEGRRRSPSRK